MWVPGYLNSELRALDRRLFLAWNGEVERFEVRMRLTEPELNLEGLPLLTATSMPWGEGRVLTLLTPTTVLVKRLQTVVGEFVYPGSGTIDYIRRMDTHRWRSTADWINHLDNLGQEEIKRIRARNTFYRQKAVHSDLDSLLKDRKYIDYGRANVRSQSHERGSTTQL